MDLYMLRMIALAELALCWVAWSLAFIMARVRAAGQKKAAKASASWWGIFLNLLGFGLILADVHPFGYAKSLPSLIASMVLAPPAVVLAWAATVHLGENWRYEAAINEEHKLVMTGPYARVRHPIYLSMLLMMLATGAAWTWWPMLVAGLSFCLLGVEIRVRAEDRLLGERFQDAFYEYEERTRAFIPFLH